MVKIISNRFTLIICAVLLTGTGLLPFDSKAQSARKIEKKAEESFKIKDYYTAAKLYASLLYDSASLTNNKPLYPYQSSRGKRSAKVKPSRRAAVLYQLAESYRLGYHYKEALKPYEEYITSGDTKYPLAKLWYGICLNASNEPEKALPVFNGFLKQHRANDTYAQMAKLGITNSNFIVTNRVLPPKAVVTKITNVVSGDGSNFALDRISDSSFWFSTSRHEVNKRNDVEYPIRLFSGKFNDNNVQRIAALSVRDMNMAASSMSPDRLTVFFTGWKNTGRSPETNYGIFCMKRETAESAWGVPVALPDPVNISGYNTRQPFLTRDNKYLFFSSDRPGGYGKYDLWVVNMDGVKPQGAALNLGSVINSNAEEASPFYDADSTRLFFSSDGREGMGGLDIFRIYGKPEGNQWSTEVVNMGYPYNSVKNDVYFSRDMRSDTAYLSSDRNSSCCLELYKAVPVVYKDTAKRVTPVTDSTAYWAAIVKQKKAQADSIAGVIAEENRIKQALMDSVNAVTVNRMNVNYNFASARIRRVDYATLNSIVRQMQKDSKLNILVASFTDCIGTKERNEAWSRKRSESVKAYLEKKGIEPQRINIDFFGKKHLILPCSEGQRMDIDKQIANRRSDLILTYDAKPKWTPSGKELDIAGKTEPNTGIINNTRNDERKGNDKETVTKKADGAGAGINTKGMIDAGDRTKKTVKQPAGKPVTEDVIDRSPRKTSNLKPKTSNQKLQTQNFKPKTLNQKTANAEPVTTSRTESFSKTVAKRTEKALAAKLDISSIVELTPRLKTPDVVEEMTKRIPRKPLYIYSTSDSVRIDLYDNGVFDYDSVSVIYNKKLVIYKELLQTTKPITFYVNLNTDQTKNEMIFFAENLGITPPNSALMIITDGNKRTEVNVTSDLDHNTVVYFIKVNKK